MSASASPPSPTSAVPHASQVNGRTIVRWARFLGRGYTDNVGGLETNDAVVTAYSRFADCFVPESLVQSAIASATEQEAETLQRVSDGLWLVCRLAMLAVAHPTDCLPCPSPRTSRTHGRGMCRTTATGPPPGTLRKKMG